MRMVLILCTCLHKSMQIIVACTLEHVTAYIITLKRHCKAKLPGKEIAMPSMPTPSSIREDIAQLVCTGKLQLGEPCVPFSLLQCTVANGEVHEAVSSVYGQKIPLTVVLVVHHTMPTLDQNRGQKEGYYMFSATLWSSQPRDLSHILR